ncbi:MAG TPA: PHP domain-containing protein, partial [Dehalococcoidia bacterium]|nr:PHP domain-containing protein [Dehalococcoidia bacterium]
MAGPDPVAISEGLRRLGFALERNPQRRHQARAFLRAARNLARVDAAELQHHLVGGTLTQLPGVGDSIAGVIRDLANGVEPSYWHSASLEQAPPPPDAAAAELLRALRGDCHLHSNWSDGATEIEEMALAARELGHEYMVLTDHSPSLTIAHGLSPERLEQQLYVIETLNRDLAPFRILTGIECDILADGSLDETDELLSRLDVVVASVHSLLRQPAEAMTPRLLAAVRNPHTDILGHCTGRIVTGRGRPQSQFDAEAVFAECARHSVAVEINSRPER